MHVYGVQTIQSKNKKAKTVGVTSNIWVYYLLSEITWPVEELKCLLAILKGTHTMRSAGEPAPLPLITKPRRFNCVLQQFSPGDGVGAAQRTHYPFQMQRYFCKAQC